nr:MAG TPA: hypothetical protein [Caudoviricetes sp.]
MLKQFHKADVDCCKAYLMLYDDLHIKQIIKNLYKGVKNDE